ncbi:hypothetical protein EDD16DRAFT_1515368 [Pisolithus croceorrhizus]|nr:hypothetical protein EDD16DRAFT_1515368 [Pisolithus croceorrhizus]
MGWPIHDMERDGTTHGQASATNEAGQTDAVGQHNLWAGPSVIWSENGTTHGWASATNEQQMSQAPCGWCMQLTDKIADYMQSQFREDALTGQHALPDISIPLPLYWMDMEISSFGTFQVPYTIDISGMAVPLKDSLKCSGNCGWWTDMVLFCQMADLKGSIDLSPGWYQQGHGQWVDQMSEFHALLSGTLAVMHPCMYASGQEVLIRLGADAQQQQDTDMSSILPIWNSVYNSMSIMVNHATPYHTDVNGWQQWLDMLIMVGDYPPLDFIVTTLNLWL